MSTPATLPARVRATHRRPGRRVPAVSRPCPRAAVLALLLALALAVAALGGCAPRALPTARPPIADLTDMPQDAGAYLDPATATLPLIPGQRHTRLAEDYLARYFAPWHRERPENGPDKVFRFLDEFDPALFHGENKLLLGAAWIERMRQLAEAQDFPNAGWPAITTTNTAMRVLPSIRPVFRSFDQAGEGYPFDYNQNTAVWAQTPLFVSHVSADGAWALVETSAAYGWLPMRDIALVDDAFMETFTTTQAVAFTGEPVPVRDCYGQYRFDGRIGMLLPSTGRDEEAYDVLLAVRDALGRAVLASARVFVDDAAPFPLEPTPANLARLANGMLGQPYGWGGMYENRDCSAMVMDLFAPLGIWQPRNSKQQVDHWGLVPLDGKDDDAKLAAIESGARPWLTLLWKPGHIMLFIGDRQGRPAILHTTWGLKTKTGAGYGRYIIGGTVITGLTPGAELPDLARPDGSLLRQLRGMARVAPGEGY